MPLSNATPKEIEEIAQLKADTFLENIERIRKRRNLPLSYMRKMTGYLDQSKVSAVYPSRELSFIDAIIISEMLGVDLGTMSEGLIE